MRTKHLLATAVVGAVIAAVPVGGAHGAVTGKGTADAALTILGAELGTDGSVLSVRLLGDDASATIDAARSSAAALRPLNVASDLLAAELTVPAVSVASTGGSSTESTETLSLDTLATSGSLEPATLTAVVDDAGARSGISSALVNLGAVGGLLDVDSVAAQLSTEAAGDSSSAIRSVEAGALTVVNLGALLEGLGVDLEALPLTVVYDLLGQLGITVDGLSVTELQALVDALNTTIDGLQAIVDGTATELSTTLCDTATDLGLDTTLLGDCTTTVALTTTQAQELLDEAQAELTAVLGAMLAAIDGTALLAVDGVTANVAAVAKSTVEASSAVVEAVIGAISVGGTVVPGLDGTATADAINTLVEDVTGEIDAALTLISPELAGVVDLDVLDITRSVTTSGDYVTSTAGVTALRATITPPDLQAVLDSLGESASTTLGVTLPAELDLSAGMETLEAGLGDGTVEALSGPSTVEVVSLSNTAAFTTDVSGQVAPPGGGEELPRTGGNAAVPMVIGVLLAGTALGIRRLLRTSSSTS